MEGANFSLSDVAAACGGGMNGANQWNNPMWLVWALMFGNGGYGFGGRGMGCGQGLQDAEIMSQLNSLREQIADNQNANALGAGIAANHEGQHDIMDRMAQCCCDNKMLSQQMGFANQLGQKDIHNGMLMGFDRTNTGLERGFSAVAYEQQRQTCELRANQDANTQRIIDTLNTHWHGELQSKYDDARLELSQLRQNATLINAMREVAAG